ncbi:YkgJ family cysteine cluster protein [Pseudomonas matsuisoli]|uniref:YkgJ family cysteine cluster protein n=1 Tax=Pseudomonas matsuisoli TaxID=1515666 RepID=UPI001E4278E7|nr:YkgJ family cysteine cluster protein [Pseudomonas matsuisoli]
MQCRSGCGACCIAPSISSPIPGLPNGKPAGMRCPHLSSELRCLIFNQPERPAVCSAFLAEAAICGTSQAQALATLKWLEGETATPPAASACLAS